MSQQLNTTSLSEFTDLVERNWSYRLATIDDMDVRKMFIYDDLTSETGEFKRYNEIDTEEFAGRMDEGEDAPIAGVSKGYEVTMTSLRFGKEIQITWKMRRHNKNPEVIAKLTSLNTFVDQRMNLDLVHRITFATSTSYTDMDGNTVTTTVGDGLALVSAVHTLNDSATTFSNVITGNPQYSQGGLEVAERQGKTQIYAHNGQQRTIDWNVVFSTNDPTLVKKIRQSLVSTADIDQNNSGVANMNKDRWTHIVLKRLDSTATGAYDSTKKDYWGLAAVGKGLMGWQAYLGVWEEPNLKTPAPGNNGDDFHNDNWFYGCRGSYGICTVSPRGFLLSTGAGS